MIELLKQLFCAHNNITTQTETNFNDELLIIKTIIQCNRCKKTFSQHPNATCCHVMHIHNEIMRGKFYDKYINAIQKI